MLKLCGFRVSNYHNKVRIVLLEKGIAHEEDFTCTPSQNEAFLARTPLGKVPFLELDGGRRLAESSVIVEYLEEAFPEKPLMPGDPFERARVRELVVLLELHVELVARRLYGIFWNKPPSEETKAAVEQDLAKGLRGLKARARFAPYIAGDALTIADCAAFVHLPLVSAATRLALGRDALEDMPQVKPYLKMLGERPAFARVAEERKAAVAAAAKK